MNELPTPDHRDDAITNLREAVRPFIVLATVKDKGTPKTAAYAEDGEIVIQVTGDGKFGEPVALCTITMGHLRNLAWVYRNPYTAKKEGE